MEQLAAEPDPLQHERNLHETPSSLSEEFVCAQTDAAKPEDHARFLGIFGPYAVIRRRQTEERRAPWRITAMFQFVLKTVGHRRVSRGFESHSRRLNKAIAAGSFEEL